MSSNPLSRRDFFKGALLAGGSAAAFGLSPRARAGAAADVHYVFCYFNGGWDILLSLDPRDPALFSAEREPETLILPAYDRLDGTDGSLIRAGGITFGPFIGDLALHADKLAVIRGMSMETLTHEAGRRRFLTGKPPSGLLARGSSSATVLASKLGRGQPIPNLALRVESYNVDQPNYATGLRASGVRDLIRALRATDPGLDPTLEAQVDHLLDQVAKCQAVESSKTWSSAASARHQARDMVLGRLDLLFDLTRNTSEMEAIRSHYRVPGGEAGLASPEAQAAMAAQAIKGGVSRVVSIEVASGLDTHFTDWATEQGPRQARGFAAVARLIEDLASSEYRRTGDTWLDHTIIVGFSEFSRTARLNPQEGRDHSLTNACFVLGAGIKGGMVVGRSSDIGMNPEATNLATGLPDPGGEIIKPEHVIQTLMFNAGFTDDASDLRVGPIDAIRKIS